jgi:protein SCO1/2
MLASRDLMRTRAIPVPTRVPRSRLTVLFVAAAWLLEAARAAGGAPPPGSLAPNFALTTQQEDRLWLAELRGRAVVLAFGCTKCGVCPGLVEGLVDIARGLGDALGPRVLFALVTVDPAHDSPGALRAFGHAHGLGPPAWVFLTEERSGEVDVVARRYEIEIRRAGDRIDASCAVTLIDAAGAIRGRYDVTSLRALDGSLRGLLGLPASR